MQPAEKIQANVEKAKQMLVKFTEEMHKPITRFRKRDWGMVHAHGKLQEASRLLEEENAIEKLKPALLTLEMYWRHLQCSQGTVTPKLKYSVRDAMTLIAVSISGHNRDEFLKVMKSAGFDVEDANVRAQILQSYHEVFRDVEGAFKKLNRNRKRPSAE